MLTTVLRDTLYVGICDDCLLKTPYSRFDIFNEHFLQHGSSSMILPGGFEPPSQGPKPCEIDHYSTGVWQMPRS